MGNVNSTIPPEGQGHPELYYRGVKAVGEARFTVAELFFVQALQDHPARKFWHTLMESVLRADSEELPLSPAKDVDADAEKKTPLVTDSDPPNASTQKNPLTAAESSGEDPSPSEPLVRFHTSLQIEKLRSGEAEGVESRSDGDGALAERQYAPKVTDVMLPLNGDLVHILDFLRLLADIAVTYLSLLSTTRHREKVMGLAARYCLLTISHTQVLLHCLTLWKEERFGDGGGFLDYEGKRQQAAGTPLLSAEVEEEEAAATGRRYLRGRPKTPVAHFVLALAEASCRYYFLSFLTNYASLILEVYKATMDRRKQTHMYANAVEHIEAVIAMAWDISREYPTEYISGLIQAHVPKPTSRGRDGQSSSGVGSCESTLKMLSQGDGQYRHLYMCGAPSLATHSAFVPLLFARRVRLCVQESGAQRSLVTLLSPAQRATYYYRKWANESVFLSTPGSSAFLLKRSLPNFQAGKGTAALSTEIIVRGAGSAGFSTGGFDADAGGGVSVFGVTQEAQGMSNAEHKVLLKKCKDVMQRVSRQRNPDLNLDDDRTCVLLCQEEVIWGILPALLMLVRMSVAAGEKDLALQRGKAVLDCVMGLTGPDTAEVHIARYVLRYGTLSCQ